MRVSPQIPCFLLVSKVWDISSGIGPASHWLEDCANFMPTPEETTNTAPTILSAIQAASQSTFINEQLYSSCDLRKWPK
jgi:hypothetical protein